MDGAEVMGDWVGVGNIFTVSFFTRKHYILSHAHADALAHSPIVYY